MFCLITGLSGSVNKWSIVSGTIDRPHTGCYILLTGWSGGVLYYVSCSSFTGGGGVCLPGLGWGSFY